MLTNEAVFARAVEYLCNAKLVVVFNGAGVSAQSGIPTFRDPLTGVWEIRTSAAGDRSSFSQ